MIKNRASFRPTKIPSERRLGFRRQVRTTGQRRADHLAVTPPKVLLILLCSTAPILSRSNPYTAEPSSPAISQAEIDEKRIEAYRGTVSFPFEAAEHKRIAIKIVNDRGIKSLKVVEFSASI